MPRDSRAILAMVELALDEFDTVTLPATVRRVVRIANLLGDSATAIRFRLELQPTAGDSQANADDIKRFLDNEETFQHPEGIARTAMEQFLRDRRLDDDRVLASSLAQLEFMAAEWASLKADAGEKNYGIIFQRRQTDVEVLDLVRSRVFAVLCGWERQFSFAARNDDILGRYRLRVDEMLASAAPEVLARCFHAES